ncbi:MAG: hypothetical protein BJ554DRAFT_7978 [Olpidium bornovanus]|uniref:CCHC-type domain-containing protein n=1 Tax=Olpidium bornovanus TaxID=278681 RepID=A0A8H7ZVN6_9FUNG|nr:MAG: hypothetical protein BJ554DRAFT_7978 [Olpidium bornovanus]
MLTPAPSRRLTLWRVPLPFPQATGLPLQTPQMGRGKRRAAAAAPEPPRLHATGRAEPEGNSRSARARGALDVPFSNSTAFRTAQCSLQRPRHPPSGVCRLRPSILGPSIAHSDSFVFFGPMSVVQVMSPTRDSKEENYRLLSVQSRTREKREASVEGRELAGESTTPLRSRTIKDSVKALRERHMTEETEQRHQEELKDLRQRLAREKAQRERAEERMKDMEAALLQAEEEEKEDDQPPEGNLNTLLAWTLLGAISTYRRRSSTDQLHHQAGNGRRTSWVSSEETLDLAVNRLVGQAATLWQNHARMHPRGTALLWKRWEELRDALTKNFHPREHLQAATAKLMEISQQSCGNDFEKFIETFNALYMEHPTPRDEHTWIIKFHMGLPVDMRRSVMQMVPALDDLGAVQEAARRDLRVMSGGTKKASTFTPVNGAGTAGEAAKKGDLKSVKCYNCSKMGHIARNCRSPKKEKGKKIEPTITAEEPKKAKESGLHVACTAGVLRQGSASIPLLVRSEAVLQFGLVRLSRVEVELRSGRDAIYARRRRAEGSSTAQAVPRRRVCRRGASGPFPRGYHAGLRVLACHGH